MLRAPVALRRFLFCLSISTSVHCVKLSAGIYRNQGPIEGLGKLRAIELAVRDAETQNKMEARLKTCGSFPDYDLVLTTSDYFELNSLWDTYSLYGPQFIHSRNCLNFAGQGRTKDSRFVTTIVSMYYQLQIPLQKRVAMSRSVTLCFVEGKWIAYMTKKDDAYVVISETAIDQRQAELILTTASSRPTEFVNNDHFMKYTYRDARFSSHMTGLSLQPVRLVHYEIPQGERYLRNSESCWRFESADDANELRDFVTAAEAEFRIAEVDVHNILLCYTHSTWLLRLGFRSIVMSYLEESSGDSDRRQGEDEEPGYTTEWSHNDEGPPSRRLKALDQ
ncbi:hypothetical protein FOZ62_025365 [Perkinsus olseni]|uniref:Uncharacterized protein n=1 Tax=Perkinsus olseni TaxID=32597 RepID=A0A7J6QGE6_PEROL|nr:hypothetical protein FOZ62_025365 [Perkinsus olseni]